MTEPSHHAPRKKPWLCRLGLHRWHRWKAAYLANERLTYCERCGDCRDCNAPARCVCTARPDLIAKVRHR